MNVLSLFAGIGGLDLGLERAGMTVVGQVEIDPFCQRVLAKHWPEVPRHDDVRTAVDWWLGTARPRVDVVCGGFPCQPVSVAGRQLAQEDPRWLWPAVAVVVRALRPRWVLLENVPGLLGRGMGDVLGDLAACGYDAEWDCIPAAAVGAPHRRDRVFIVAHPGGIGCGEGPRQLGRMGPAECGQDVADAGGEARRPEAGHAQPGAGGAPVRERPPEPGRRGRDVAYAHRAGLERPRIFGAAPERGGAWRTEPDVGRVAHGIPGRVDRLRGLGNAVVPQVGEHIGRLVMAAP